MPSAVTSIISVADGKNYLRKKTSVTIDDTELQIFIDGITPVVEEIIGDVVGHTYSEWHDGMVDTIIPMRHPILTVASVTEYVGTVSYALTEQSPDAGNPLDAFGFYVDYDAGTIQRTAYGVPTWFAALPWWAARTPGWYVATPARTGTGSGRVKVVYTTGRASVPPNVKMAALEILRANWQPTQLGYTPAYGSGEQGDLPQPGQEVLGYLVPRRAMQWLAPHAQNSKVIIR